MRNGFAWYSILVIVVLILVAIVLGCVVGYLAIDNKINDEELDTEVPESWPYLSERNWYWSAFLGGLAFFGLALSMIVGVV